MRLLLDTHAFIWWHSEQEHLSPRALACCQDSRYTLILSIASLWEMQIKEQLGKLELKTALQEMVEQQQQVNQLELLPIDFKHILALKALPPLHKDPFDRMLIAQSRLENLPIITKDPAFKDYGVNILW